MKKKKQPIPIAAGNLFEKPINLFKFSAFYYNIIRYAVFVNAFSIGNQTIFYAFSGSNVLFGGLHSVARRGYFFFVLFLVVRIVRTVI